MMRLNNKVYFTSLLFVFTLLMASCSACNSNKTTTKASEESTLKMSYNQISPEFNSDSAFVFIKEQLDFGPRVPNSAGHLECGNYLVA